MMNAIAVALVVASMAIAGVWSPDPESSSEQVIMKGGHRAVVVEYAGDDSAHGNTKVFISPPVTAEDHHKGVLSTAEDKLSSAKDAAVGAVGPDGKAAGDWICDAFGKCKHKISGAIYKAKHKVSETAEEVEEGARETANTVIDTTKEAASKAKHAAEQGTEKAKQTAARAKQAAEQGTEKAKQTAARAKEAVEDTSEELKHKSKSALGKAGEAAEKAKRSASRAGEAAEEKAEKAISEVAKKGKEIWSSLMGLVHLLGFATAYGTGAWVTFAMSHLLARSLPRQQFGVVQSRVYPVYFKAMAASLGLALMGHLLGERSLGVSSLARNLQSYNLGGLVAMVLANLFFLEPQATRVMYERMKLEKEEGRGVSVQTTRFVDQTGAEETPLSTTTTTMQRREDGGEVKSKMERLTTRLRKLNSYSSLLNVMTLMGLTWHLVYLSQRLCV